MARRTAIITIIVVLLLSWGGVLATAITGTKPLLGLDLQGGFSVVLAAPEGTDQEVLEKAVDIMRNRIEALGGVQEPQIQVRDDGTIEVQLPGVTDRERALAAVGRTGQLEFRPVLDVSAAPGVSPLVVEAAALEAEQDAATTTTTTPGDDTTTTTAPDEAPPEIPESLLPDGVAFCSDELPVLEQPGCVDRDTGFTLNPVPELPAYLLDPVTGEAFALGPASVLGSDLSNAEARFQQQGAGGQAPLGVGFGGAGQWVVVLEFTNEGADKFEETTKELTQYAPGDPRRRFAIVLDGTVQSAPQISPEIPVGEGISGGTAIITLGGSEDQESEARDLAIVLRYGALPVAFEQQTVQSVSATLGSDSLQAGLIAGIGGLILVAAAMIAYYRALGLVNVVGLSVFASVLWVTYSLLGETQGVTLTLAGVAGVIVSIGITSDSYIVYFERIKEEVHGGRSLRAAINHAFSRAFRTILTADTVSFSAAVLLFLLAAGSVRGFALALGLATIADVVVAYFFTRPAVALVARTQLGEGGKFSIRGATGSAVEVTP
jgi:preprotein translocase subunit SecD